MYGQTLAATDLEAFGADAPVGEPASHLRVYGRSLRAATRAPRPSTSTYSARGTAICGEGRPSQSSTRPLPNGLPPHLNLTSRTDVLFCATSSASWRTSGSRVLPHDRAAHHALDNGGNAARVGRLLGELDHPRSALRDSFRRVTRHASEVIEGVFSGARS